MKKYIALLRGVNVGGKNKISMSELKDTFEDAGFLGVRTYINSGNVLFLSEDTDILALQDLCRKVIANTFHMDIAVAVISADDFKEALSHVPDWWDRDVASKHNAIVVIAPENADSVIKAVGAAKPEYESVFSYGQVIFWSAATETFSRTRWSKVTSTTAYQSITIRNANTAKKLLSLCFDG